VSLGLPSCVHPVAAAVFVVVRAGILVINE
jgi:hypothetical protein